MSGTTGGYDQNALLLALMNAGGSGQQQSPMPQQSSLLNALSGSGQQQWQTPNIFGYGNMGAGTPNAQPAGQTTGGTPNSTALPQQTPQMQAAY